MTSEPVPPSPTEPSPQRGDAHLHNAARMLERVLADQYPEYTFVVDVEPAKEAE